MNEGTETDEIEVIDDNGAIRERDAEEFHELGKQLLELNRALKIHGHSMSSLFKDFALRVHGIRL